MFIKEEKGSTLLLKIFAILFGIFFIFGYVFTHAVDSEGNIVSDFYMQILYMAALGIIASLGFLTITLITMEWGARRQPEERFGRIRGSNMPDFYRNCIAFLNCLKIAVAVFFCIMFFNYSRSTITLPMAVFASLFLDCFLWNKRCREVIPTYSSLLLDVVDEFMRIFSTKKSRSNPVLHRQSAVFYVVATLFIVFCAYAVSVKMSPHFRNYRELSPENLATIALADSIITAELEAREKKVEPVKVKVKKRKSRKPIVPVTVPVAESVPAAQTAAIDDEDDDW